MRRRGFDAARDLVEPAALTLAVLAALAGTLNVAFGFLPATGSIVLAGVVVVGLLGAAVLGRRLDVPSLGGSLGPSWDERNWQSDWERPRAPHHPRPGPPESQPRPSPPAHRETLARYRWKAPSLATVGIVVGIVAGVITIVNGAIELISKIH